MNAIIAVALFTGMNLFFVKDSPNLLARILPETPTQQITLYYSFHGADWDTMDLNDFGVSADAVIVPPESLRVVGLYAVYGNTVDDNKKNLYLYEVKRSPKMLMPFTLADLQAMLKQARKKITSGIHADEGVALLDYILEIAPLIPYIKGTALEADRLMLQNEAAELKVQAGQ
jgi:hypothetical protein